MKKYGLIVILALIVVAAAAFIVLTKPSKETPATAITGQSTPASQDSSQTAKPQAKPVAESVPSNVAPQTASGLTAQRSMAMPANWKTYTNDKLGFTFQYPAAWTKDAEDANVTNLKGASTEIDIRFTDAATQTTLLVAYHLAPNGTTLYEYAVSQFHARKDQYATNGKEVTVGGNAAIQGSSAYSIDGKGHRMAAPLKTVFVDVQDKAKTGELQFQFQTPEAGADMQLAAFNQVLTSFKFTK